MKNNKLKKGMGVSLAAVMAASMIPACSLPAFAAEPGTTEEATIEDLASASIGGITYFYTDTAGDNDDTVYRATVRSRMGSTEYNFSKADLTEVTDTDYGYVTVPGVTPLEGTLYGYGAGTTTTYKEIYNDLGVSTDESYDVISSATKYTSHHAGDIPSLVSFGTDAAGDKAITGLTLSREVKEVKADTYVEASILKAASVELTEDQTAALDITLKANPTVAPSTDTIPAKLGSIEYTESKYGAKAINIYPDDTVEGYVWNEYLDSIYAATISDGTNTVGAVHWIDLYGESAATPGYHYNKVEFELNNGLVPESNPNGATVNRFASFFDAKTGNLKPGTYTVRVYAEGYDMIEGSITLKTGWQQEGGEWHYYDADYNIVTNSWAKDSAGWCWLGEDGTITKSKWIKDNGEWYFLKANGYMAANEWAKDSGGWYYMNKSGKISKNAWAKDSKGWMYLGANGRITKSKWIQAGGQWYYMKANGYMSANEWAKDSGGWMYMDANGKISKNKWIKSGGKWYYLKANGYMATGSIKINGKTYKFDASGRWIS